MNEKRPLRLAISALGHRAYVGRTNKAGDCFLDGKQDVTNDFLKAVVDYFNEHEVVITTNGGKAFKVRCVPCEYPQVGETSEAGVKR